MNDGVTDNESGVLLQHIYKFCWRAAVGSSKSADLFLHHESSLIKHCIDATGDFKN
jgi:hypothetical protein